MATAAFDTNAATGGLLINSFFRNGVFFAFGCLIGASPGALRALVTRRDAVVLAAGDRDGDLADDG